MSPGSCAHPQTWTPRHGTPCCPPRRSHPLHAPRLPGRHASSGSALRRTGWTPASSRCGGDGLVAACPLYIKAHSYGEYVFDWAWANAYEQHGLAYYPKAVVAVPFTPVPGPRLLARDAASRRRCWCRRWRGARRRALVAAPAVRRRRGHRRLRRSGPDAPPHRPVPLDWRQLPRFRRLPRQPSHDKRKKIRQERRKVRGCRRELPLVARHRHRVADWDFFYRCYARTYREHGNPPYLTPRLLPGAWRDTMPRSLAALRRRARWQAHRLQPDRAIDDAARRLRPLLGRAASASTACISRPATTSRSRGASHTAAALRRRRPGRAQDGAPDAGGPPGALAGPSASPTRSTSSWSAKAPASRTTWNTWTSAARSRRRRRRSRSPPARRGRTPRRTGGRRRRCRS